MVPLRPNTVLSDSAVSLKGVCSNESCRTGFSEMHRMQLRAGRKVPIVGASSCLYFEELLLAKLRSSEIDIVSLLFHQRYKWASSLIPHTHLKRVWLMPSTSLSSNNIQSFTLSLGCLCCSQSYSSPHNMWNTVGKSKPLTLGCLWLLLLFLSVREMKFVENKQLYGCWVLGIVFVFVKQIPVFTKIGLYPAEKRKSKACGKSFCHVYSGVSSVAIVLFCSVVLCGGSRSGLRWGGLSSLFPSVAYRFLLCIKLPWNQ